MTEVVVLDASAALAVLNGEPGAETVEAHLPGALISSVNAAEVASKLVDGGTEAEGAMVFIQRLGLKVIAFEEADITVTALLRGQTRSAGLSLGDRVCLALAQRFQVPAVTSDREWGRVETGVEVRLIRD